MNNLTIYPSLALNLDANLISAALPLLEAGEVHGVEWSFDVLYNQAEIPEWFDKLLLQFGKENRLIGHGVYFSIFSGKWSLQQQHWLDELNAFSSHYNFNHVSEHFGYDRRTFP